MRLLPVFSRVVGQLLEGCLEMVWKLQSFQVTGYGLDGCVIIRFMLPETGRGMRCKRDIQV